MPKLKKKEDIKEEKPVVEEAKPETEEKVDEEIKDIEENLFIPYKIEGKRLVIGERPIDINGVEHVEISLEDGSTEVYSQSDLDAKK